MAKNIPWLFVTQFSVISHVTILYWILPIQALNTFFIYKFFKDRYDSKSKMEKIHTKSEKFDKNFLESNKISIFLTLSALVLAETTFYVLWIFLESGPALQKWLTFTTLGTFFGVAVTILYRRLPHFSIITILYSILAGTTLISLFLPYSDCLSDSNKLIMTMVLNCMIGGVYLPFVADALIELAGPTRKATGSAFSEAGDMIALLMAAVLAIFELASPFYLLITITLLYSIATMLQKIAEKKANLFPHS